MLLPDRVLSEMELQNCERMSREGVGYILTGEIEMMLLYANLVGLLEGIDDISIGSIDLIGHTACNGGVVGQLNRRCMRLLQIAIDDGDHQFFARGIAGDGDI